MNWIKTFKKAGLGFLTFVVSYLTIHPEMIFSLLPENLTTMTVGGAITAIIVWVNNWLKHRNV